MRVKVRDSQSVFDLALQEAGGVEAAMDISVQNDVSITDELEAGAEMIMPQAVSKNIAAYYKNNAVIPATALSAQDKDLFGE